MVLLLLLLLEMLLTCEERKDHWHTIVFRSTSHIDNKLSYPVNKAEPSSEPEGELIGVGKAANDTDAREHAMANARQAGHDLYKLQTNQRLTAYVYQDTETGAYEYRYYKLDAPDPGNPNLGL